MSSQIGMINIELIYLNIQKNIIIFQIDSKNMNNQALNNLLQQFAAQRKYREQKRKQFLRRFDQLKGHFGSNSNHRSHVQVAQEQKSRVRESIPEHQQPQR